MTPAEQVRLTLDLDPTPGTMRGSLTDAHGERWRFDGWVQLANALRTAHDATPPAAPDLRNGERLEAAPPPRSRS